MSESLKFLFVSDFLPDHSSGTPGTVLSFSEALRAAGHETEAIWRTHRPSFFNHPALYRLLELPKRQFSQVKRKLKQKHYDVVIISQPYSYLIYENLQTLYPKTLFLNLSHGWEDRVYAQCHAWESFFQVSPMRVITKFLTRRACARTVKACHGVLISSQRGRQFIEKNYQDAENKAQLILYGLDNEFLNLDFRTRSVSNNSRMLYVGNYLPIKGSKVMEDILPEIARRFRNVSMTFVGPSSQIAYLKSQYEPSFGGRLSVFPWMGRNELLKIYLNHDILIFPSLFEGFGKSALEAMACGVCVVGYDEGCLPDLAVSGEHAFHCKAGHRNELVALLAKCIEQPELARAAGRAAHEKVRNFSWEYAAAVLVRHCLNLRKEKLPLIA